MPSLFDRVKQNDHLRYFNSAGDVLDLHSVSEAGLNSYSKDLAILYVDNSIASLGVFWRFYASSHAIALLSPGLNIGLKKEIEEAYKPLFIFDSGRTDVTGYILKDGYFLRGDTDMPGTIHENIKILLSTSGTTGSPKFVKLSDENLIQNALSIVDYLPINHNDTTPLNLPIYYSYGLSVLTSNSLAGGKVFCTNKDILSSGFWDELKAFEFTSIAGVPYVYEMLSRIGFLKKDYPSLRYLTQAGGRLNETLVAKFAEYAESRGILFYVMYGQTEATARMSYLHPSVTKSKLGSIGKPIKNGAFEIDTVTAELTYRGPNVFGGYANNRFDLEEFSPQGVLKTGDLARVDGDGYYYVIGRAKRFAKIFGLRVNVDEVENALVKKFNASFACIGVEDNYLLIANNAAVNQATIKEYVRDLYNIHPTAVKATFRQSFPLTQNGKIDYVKIFDEFNDLR
jgi:acyl-coenzyme A synthetase/AMP-(fatty) acid ligase